MPSTSTLLRLLAVFSVFGAPVPAAGKTLIAYFLPMPVQGRLTTNIWGAESVLPRNLAKIIKAEFRGRSPQSPN